jgi:hypothetical protein
MFPFATPFFPSLYKLYTSKLYSGQTIWDKIKVILAMFCGIHWELGEHYGDFIGTPWGI